MLAVCGGYKLASEVEAATYADEGAARAALSKLLKQIVDEVSAISDKYDDDTRPGVLINATQQALWKARIEAWYNKKTLGGPP